MSRAHPTALTLSHAILRLLIVVNLLFGLLILGLLVATLVAQGPTMTALGVRPGSASVALGMRLIMLVGLLSVPLTHLVLTRLKAIVGTVRAGDPFVAGNAPRLQAIAWALLGLELLHLAAGAIAAIASTPADPLDIDWNFSVAGWLAVLLLFVLARVFESGARMREDLEGTV